MKKYPFLFAPLCFIVFFSCYPNEDPTVKPVITKPDTLVIRKVLEHHFTTFKENNLAGIMEDYTDSSVVVTPDGVFRGLDQIRRNYENSFRLFPKDSSTLDIVMIIIEDNLVYFLWHAKTPTLDMPLGSDTFIMDGYKIKQQTFAGYAIEGPTN